MHRIFPDHNALSEYVADVILETVKQKPDALISLATGDTPMLAYQKTVAKAKLSGVDFSSVYFAALDEWIGVPKENPGSCDAFLHQHLFDPLGMDKQRIHLFDGISRDLTADCRRSDAFIAARGKFDLMVAGIGINGHIGFNEPNTDPGLRTHVADLHETTRSVGQKYFPSAIELTRGVTLGLQFFAEASKVIVMANGKHKSEVIGKSLNGPVIREVPASLLRDYAHCVFCIDELAATDL